MLANPAVAEATGRLLCDISSLRVGNPAAGEWLLRFQNSDVAWGVCAQVLLKGPRGELEHPDSEFLHAFCAQTLASFARALTNRIVAIDQQLLFRSTVDELLALHLPPAGRPAVWRQLTFALTCADLWLGKWSADPVLKAGVSLPTPVRHELLTLPTDLLFCERALPLSDVSLWRHAAAGLLEACDAVFGHLSSIVVDCGQKSDAHNTGQALQAIATWLRATRLAHEWLPHTDPVAPLKSFADHAKGVLQYSYLSVEAAAEVTQQVARWTRCDEQVVPLLREMLYHLFAATKDGSFSRIGRPNYEVILPVLADLAADRWPRAALGDISLDWVPISTHAQSLLKESMRGVAEGAESGCRDAEAALAVWQTFAHTCVKGTMAWEDEAEHGSSHSEWSVPYERLVHAEALPQLFASLAVELLELLKIPSVPRADEIRTISAIRGSAQNTIAAWAGLIGDSPAWHNVTWAPLHRIGQRLSAGIEGKLDEDVLREAEVVLWMSFTLASSWQERANSVPAALAVLEISQAISISPEPWRSLLRSSACDLASTGPRDHLPMLIEFMIEHSPYSSGDSSLALLEFTELPFAQALEMACRQLPIDSSHAVAAERVLKLALSEVPSSALHRQTSSARALLLKCLRHLMGGDAISMCRGLSEQVLPVLREASFIEAAKAASLGGDRQWHAARTFFATLSAMLPPPEVPPITDGGHPIVAMWSLHLSCFEAALLVWPISPVSNQPLLSATEALGLAALRAPVLLEQVLRLLSESTVVRTMPDVQLKVFCDVLEGAHCLPLIDVDVAGLLSQAIVKISSGITSKGMDVAWNPTTLSPFFKLLSAAFLEQRYGDRLWVPLVQTEFIPRSISLFCHALPVCTSSEASGHMMRFAIHIFTVDTERKIVAHQNMLRAALPDLCKTLCRALTTQEHLTVWEGLVEVAEFLWTAADAFPVDFFDALAIGSASVTEVPEWSKGRLARHVAGRGGWPRRGAWISELHQLVQEWQRESRLSLSKLQG